MIDMERNFSFSVYKKKNDEKIMIIPSGNAENGLISDQKRAIIINSNSPYSEIGDMINLGAELTIKSGILKVDSDKQTWQLVSEEKNWSNFAKKYDLIRYYRTKGKYSFRLGVKDRYGFSPFPDKENGEYIFGEKIEAEELGKKLIEMFKFKEEYDNS
jgi:hypothetical protein